MNEKEYSFKMNLLCIIKNIVSIICFTILAIMFNRWWIIFFSLLFMVKAEEKNDNKEDICAKKN